MYRCGREGLLVCMCVCWCVPCVCVLCVCTRCVCSCSCSVLSALVLCFLCVHECVYVDCVLYDVCAHACISAVCFNAKFFAYMFELDARELCAYMRVVEDAFIVPNKLRPQLKVKMSTPGSLWMCMCVLCA